MVHCLHYCCRLYYLHCCCRRHCHCCCCGCCRSCCCCCCCCSFGSRCCCCCCCCWDGPTNTPGPATAAAISLQPTNIELSASDGGTMLWRTHGGGRLNRTVRNVGGREGIDAIECLFIRRAAD